MTLDDILNTHLGRRALLKSSLAGGGAALAGTLFGGWIPNVAWGADATAKYETPVVETASGKLRGVIQQGVQETCQGGELLRLQVVHLVEAEDQGALPVRGELL